MEQFFRYKLLDKYIKTGFFGGRKYVVVIEINNQVREVRTGPTSYYSMPTEGEINMISEDGKIWYIKRS